MNFIGGIHLKNSAIKITAAAANAISNRAENFAGLPNAPIILPPGL